MRQTVREVRRRAEMTQAELASKAGVSTMTISRLERGVVDVSFGVAARILAALEADPGDILGAVSEEMIRQRGGAT